MLGFSMMSVAKDFCGNLALFWGKSDSSLMDLIRSMINSLCLLVGTINVVSLMINLPFGDCGHALSLDLPWSISHDSAFDWVL